MTRKFITKLLTSFSYCSLIIYRHNFFDRLLKVQILDEYQLKHEKLVHMVANNSYNFFSIFMTCILL